MNRFLSILLLSGMLAMTHASNAQFRSIPGAVTDSFKVKYPGATGVKWADKVSNFQATFTQQGEVYTAKYSSKGEWQSSTKKISEDKLPASVKDGLSKSKYAAWKINTYTLRYLPENKTEYILAVQNGDLNKKNLTFSSEGQLLSDSRTL
jgi:hypothetical protein